MKRWASVGVLSSGACAAVYYLRQNSLAWPGLRPDAACGTCDSSKYELKLVQVLFRHGARTPLKPIPNSDQVEWSPNLLKTPTHTLIDYTVTDLNGDPQPPSPVEDSYRGRRLYELGEKLRKIYVDEFQFLSPVYKPSEVYVRSTNIVRTIESARCLLAGLFQQKQEGPVNILTATAQAEILYPNYFGCKQLKLLSGHRWRDAAFLPSIINDLKQIHSLLGLKEHSNVDFILLRDNVVASKAHGLPEPPALQSWYHIIEEKAMEMISHIFQPANRENLQLCVGPVLQILIENIDHVIENKTTRKLYLYSVHDTTLMPYLMALGIFDMKWPPYAADVTLELYQHRASKEMFVKVSYVGKDQLVKGCSAILCPLEEFRKALSQYAIDQKEYKRLCTSPELSQEFKK
nr:PREDICTED: lysophosphatidic acid phosphatase type 6 [Latimeria chalumnae]|eukprot:XP_014354270.1 PREDICTED: lysophosphatidic acid phosphatase type 6 [Latimeria chalumnae]